MPQPAEAIARAAKAAERGGRKERGMGLEGKRRTRLRV